MINITDLQLENKETIRQAADLLVLGFREHWPNAWPNHKSALEEVMEALQAEKINRIALDDDGRILGWIGAIPEYYGHAWELHPLVVRPGYQGRGIGAALVKDLEKQIMARGGVTIYLGTDDEDQMTTLSNTDLYSDLFEKLAKIENLRAHPYEFYQKQGFTIVGVIPDANGLGKPDILMAKRIQP